MAEATVKLLERGLDPQPEIMIPLIATVQELALLRERAEAVLAEVFEGVDREPPPIGTMIELPRAALTAGDIAASADFFSFGTNDLTQTTFGLSRDDGGSFLPHYKDVGIVAQDPFVSIDIGGVGRLVRIACEEGRAAKPDLKIGVCGEHGGDPASVHFFDEVGLDYVSCSPFRVPVARLVAAQATIGASGPEND